MICLNNQKAATYMYGVEKYEEGIVQGIEQGIEQGKINSFVSLFNDKRITAKEGAEYLGIGVNEFLELVGKH